MKEQIKLNTMRQKAEKLIKLRNEFSAVAKKLETELQEKCDFKCGIEDIPGDGLCVINEKTAQVAPLFQCIEEIERVGRLGIEEHDDLCI